VAQWLTALKRKARIRASGGRIIQRVVPTAVTRTEGEPSTNERTASRNQTPPPSSGETQTAARQARDRKRRRPGKDRRKDPQDFSQVHAGGLTRALLANAEGRGELL